MSDRCYVGIDDTGNLEGRGTGCLAVSLATHLADAGLGRSLGVTRHRLLVDPRIVCTSDNGAACLHMEVPDRGVIPLAIEAAGFLDERVAPDSNAGLCVATERRVTDDVVAFGHRAKQAVLTLSEARALVTAARIHLSGHSGEGGGMIGALAAVGLRHQGEDGRFLELNRLLALRGVVTVAAINAAGICRFRAEQGEVHLSAYDFVDVGDWCRPILEHREPTLLLVEPAAHEGPVRWRIATKEQINAY